MIQLKKEEKIDFLEEVQNKIRKQPKEILHLCEELSIFLRSKSGQMSTYEPTVSIKEMKVTFPELEKAIKEETPRGNIWHDNRSPSSGYTVYPFLKDEEQKLNLIEKIHITNKRRLKVVNKLLSKLNK